MKLVLALGLLSLSPALAGAQTVAPLENRVPRPVPVRELDEAISFPVPPEQNAPFDEKDDASGRVVKRMFDAGLADPRGLEYREVEFLGAPAWRTPGETGLPSRAFVLPSSDSSARFAVAWDGQIYRVSRVGQTKDPRADLSAMKPPAHANEPWFSSITPAQNLDFSTATVLKAVMAERLGAPRSLFSEIQLKGAALPFVTQVSNRGAGAHLRGDDAAALALLRKAKLARGSLSEAFGTNDPPIFNFQLFFNSQPSLQLGDDEQLLADQERRAQERAAPRIFPDTLSRLIGDLQNVDARQHMIPGSVSLVGDPRVRALVKVGDSAVPALIETVASDNRLTRSLEIGNLNSGVGQVLPVSMAAYDALMEIWGVQKASDHLFGRRYDLGDPQKRAETVARLRAYAATRSALPPLTLGIARPIAPR